MKRCGFRLNDKKHPAKTAKEAYFNALRVLKRKKCPTLYETLGKMVNTNNRGYFVRSDENVYKSSPELGDKEGYIEKLEPGWYSASNISNREKEIILIYACAVAGIKYLEDLEIWFDGGNNKYTPMTKEEIDDSIKALDVLWPIGYGEIKG